MKDSRISGLAAWSIHHPIGVVMLTLAVMVLGAFALERLNIDLLPHIIYPEVRARILDPGVPATIMEDDITRQLEEQLAPGVDFEAALAGAAGLCLGTGAGSTRIPG